MKQNSLNFKVVSIVSIALICGFMFVPSLTTILLVGMLPTIGALLVDQSAGKVYVFCVGCCNVSGLLPIILELVQHRFSLQIAANILDNPGKILTVLACAAVGWGIAAVVPSLTVMYYRTKDRSTMHELMRKYSNLKKIWGDAIPAYEIFKTIQSSSDHGRDLSTQNNLHTDDPQFSRHP